MQRWWKRGSEKHVRCGKCHSHVESQLLSILGCPNKNNIIDTFIHPGPSLSLYPKNNEFKKAGFKTSFNCILCWVPQQKNRIGSGVTNPLTLYPLRFLSLLTKNNLRDLKTARVPNLNPPAWDANEKSSPAQVVRCGSLVGPDPKELMLCPNPKVLMSNLRIWIEIRQVFPKLSWIGCLSDFLFTKSETLFPSHFFESR